jgi:hypothetical protein
VLVSAAARLNRLGGGRPCAPQPPRTGRAPRSSAAQPVAGPRWPFSHQGPGGAGSSPRSPRPCAGAPISPGSQGREDRPQRFTVSCECVVAPDRRSRVDLSVHEPGVLQFSEAVGQHPIGKARDGPFEFAEASWTLQQEKQKLEHPPLGQHLQLPRQRRWQLNRGLVSTTCLASHSTAYSCLLAVQGAVLSSAGEKLQQPGPARASGPRATRPSASSTTRSAPWPWSWPPVWAATRWTGTASCA